MFNLSYGFGAASNPAVARLQRAVILLGLAVRDTKLAIKADGATGPATAAAVNRALTAYVKSAPAQYRTGKLTAAQVGAAASALSSLVEAEAAKRGTGAAPKAVAKAAPAKTPPGTKTVTTKKPAPTKPVPSTALAALQNALKTLGTSRKDSTLSAVKPDGLIGPKTIAAVNLAFKKYVTNAAAQYRTGKLTGTEIVAMAQGLADMVKAAPAPAGKPGAEPKPGKNQDVAQIQTLLGQLAKGTGDKTLAVTADGLIGPKTTTAANKALQKHATGAPPTLRTGKLTSAQVVANAPAIVNALAAAVAATGTKPVKAPPVAKGKLPASAAAAASSLVKRMQKLLVQLAGLTSDPVLKIDVDGKMGPKTAAAANKALSKYATAAAPMLRTGALTPASLVSQAKAVNTALKAAIKSRGQEPVAPTTDEAVAETTEIPGEVPQAAPGQAQIPGMKPPTEAEDRGPPVPGQLTPGATPYPGAATAAEGGGAAPGGGGGGGLPSSGGGGGGGLPAPGGGGEAPAPGGDKAPGEEAPPPGAEAPAGGLSTAAKVGIGVGAAALLGTGIYFLARKKKPGGSPSRARYSRRLRTA